MSNEYKSKQKFSLKNLAIASLIVLVVMVSCTEKGSDTAKIEVSKLTPAEKVGESILSPYTRSGYPKLFEKFGSRMADVEKARAAGVWLAANNDKCVKIENVDVSSKSTRSDIEVFIDCSGGQRFRFSEAELKDSRGQFFSAATVSKETSTLTQAEKALSTESALRLCKEAVLSSAKFRSSVKFEDHIARTSSANGDTWVELDFVAKNGLGADLPHKAHCNFPIRGDIKFDISNR